MPKSGSRSPNDWDEPLWPCSKLVYDNRMSTQSAPLSTLTDDARHVLVVDDDKRIRSLLSQFLKSHGYRVTNA
jgi:response regulator RpfG family c-di-GMP phosphodiesterase